MMFTTTIQQLHTLFVKQVPWQNTPLHCQLSHCDNYCTVMLNWSYPCKMLIRSKMAVVDQQLQCFFASVKTDNWNAKKYQNTTSTTEQSTMSYNQYKVQTLYQPQSYIQPLKSISNPYKLKLININLLQRLNWS